MKRVFCMDCARRFFDEHGEPTDVYLAMFGPQGLTDEDAMLVSSLWVDYASNPMFMILHPGCRPLPCDGCSREVSISPSSGWFIDAYQSENR